MEQLKKFGKDKDYIEILAEGKFKMFDDNIVLDGSWEYLKEGKFFKVVLFPTEKEKAAGGGDTKMKYTVVEVDKDYLTLKLGKIMTTKYKKAEK